MKQLKKHKNTEHEDTNDQEVPSTSSERSDLLEIQGDDSYNSEPTEENENNDSCEITHDLEMDIEMASNLELVIPNINVISFSDF